MERRKNLPEGFRSRPDRAAPPSTVGRGRSVTLNTIPRERVFRREGVTLCLGDSLDNYGQWDPPDVIISDGGYGLLGFEGDTSDHLGLPDWYEPHIRAWSRSVPRTATLWFWNSEIGWAAVHPVLERHGWRYVNCNIWNKGKAHIAGNINTAKIRRFPVVTEVCVQYVKEVRINGMILREWLLHEWRRTGLPLSKANEACGVRDAAVRKYLDQGHLWYFPPPEALSKLVAYANCHGRPEGRPYFSLDGTHPLSGEEWATFRTTFTCPHGFTNVWNRSPVNGRERLKVPSGRATHLNQKPLDLTEMIIRASSEEGDVVWEPFGGLFTACIAAYRLKMRAFGSEIDPTYFLLGVERFKAESAVMRLL
jgi:site-specific DNA-methyltransferase (adenine-specific)